MELPTFLKDSYNHEEINYQEHVNFTVSSEQQKTAADNPNLERKRLAHFNFTLWSEPQPIKVKRAMRIPIHFFLSDGSRAHQQDEGPLTDTTNSKTATSFVPFRNVAVSIYRPIIDTHWFQRINHVDFLKTELQRQRRRQQQQRQQSSLDLDTIQKMITLDAIYNTVHRLTTASGKLGDGHLGGEVSERVDSSGAFFKRSWRACGEIWRMETTSFERKPTKWNIPRSWKTTCTVIVRPETECRTLSIWLSQSATWRCCCPFKGWRTTRLCSSSPI